MNIAEKTLRLNELIQQHGEVLGEILAMRDAAVKVLEAVDMDPLIVMTGKKSELDRIQAEIDSLLEDDLPRKLTPGEEAMIDQSFPAHNRPGDARIFSGLRGLATYAELHRLAWTQEFWFKVGWTDTLYCCISDYLTKDIEND